MSLRLIIEDDEGTTTVVPLGRDAVTIGRQQGNTIQLTEKNVSRRHARLYPDQEAWIVEDLGSYNGVRVNAQKVEGRVVLQEGDVIQIGDYHLALTENVDRRTLNYDRPPEAANDVEPPLLVSSSTDLPRLSPEELAALSSGPHTPQPMLLDSGPVPAMSSPHYAREKSGSGALVAVVIVVVAALGLGGAWLVTSGNAPPTQVAENTPSATPPTPAEAEPSAPEPVEAVAVVEEQPTDEVEEIGEEPSADDGADDLADDLEIETSPSKPDSKASKPQPSSRAVKKPASTTSTSTSSTASQPAAPRSKPATADASPPKPPPPPPVDADQLLADARQASMANQLGKAYELAKKAYKEKPSQDALNVMATAACKMGDASKAKFAIGKLTGQRKEDAKKLCEIKGITI